VWGDSEIPVSIKNSIAKAIGWFPNSENTKAISADYGLLWASGMYLCVTSGSSRNSVLGVIVVGFLVAKKKKMAEVHGNRMRV
jgi:hypothetical protein